MSSGSDVEKSTLKGGWSDSTASGAGVFARPSRIGPYQIVKEIGEGGMGVVLKAVQVEPVRRTVALKLIKPGMDSQAIIARFKSERQALAMMNHKNIARVFDAGRSDMGRPYFVMEYVNGTSLERWCIRDKVALDDRLRVFVEICNGIQHAHQKGIVHRDLTNNNVLIAIEDDQPVPKIIDFGLAKALGFDLTDQDVVTGGGGVLGTPPYMSPEQLAGDSGVDTRTDIYALGVILYRLLTSCYPFDPNAEGRMSFHKLVTEVDPVPPSRRVVAGRAGAPSVDTALFGADGHAFRKRVSKILSGDLDSIILRALEKRPAKRYASASEFAADVQRYLSGQPVLARSIGLPARILRIVRRKRRVLIVSAAVLLVLSLFFANLLRSAYRESRWSAFCQSLVGLIVRNESRAEDIEELRAQLNKIAVAFGPKSKQVVWASISLARSLESRRQFAEAERHLRDALDIVAGSGFAPCDPDKIAVYRALGKFLASRGKEFEDSGRLSEAVGLFEREIECVRAVGSSFELRQSLERLGHLHRERGDLTAAVSVFEEVLSLEAEKGEDRLRTMKTIAALKLNFGAPSRDQGIRLLRESLNREVASHGPHSGRALTTRRKLANSLWYLGRFEDAERLFRQNIARSSPSGGGFEGLYGRSLLGKLLSQTGKFEEAESLCREAVEEQRRIAGEEDPDTLLFSENLAAVLLARGKLLEAKTVLRAVVDARRRSVSPGEINVDLLISMRNLGEILYLTDDDGEARMLIEEALELWERAGDAREMARILALKHDLALLDSREGGLTAAEVTLAEVIQESLVLAPDTASVSWFQTIGWFKLSYGKVLMRLGRVGLSEEQVYDGYSILKQWYGEQHWRVRHAWGNLETVRSCRSKDVQGRVDEPSRE